jgi:dihydroxyacetone kinase-like protein
MWFHEIAKAAIMWFHEIAKAASTEPVEVSSLAAGVSNGLAPSSVSAKQGYNTMVDAIAPAADALTHAAAQQSNLGEALEAAAHAARVGAESTRSLIASRGRASYVGEVARGVLGPGAVSVALFFASAVVTNGGQEPDNSWLSGWRRLSAWKALAVLIDATAK